MAIILLIEDDEDQRVYIKLMLATMGHNVIEAGDGNQGIQRFKEHAVDIVITDIFMPEKEGLSTIMEIKTIEPETKIIAMSAGNNALADALDIASELGADIVLKKPLDIEELSQVINTALLEVLPAKQVS